MSYALAHGRTMDVGSIGLAGEALGPFEAGPIDLCAWFGPQRAGLPLELEVGCGKGTFLVEQAQQTPRVNFIGLEYAKRYWRYAADRCRRHGLENVRIVHVEVDFFVRNYVPDAQLSQVHIYFPDPWPKKRHHKRRLLTEAFLRQLHRTLQPAAKVQIVTDHHPYFQWISQCALLVKDAYAANPFKPGDSGTETEWVGTNFERKYRRMGRRVYGLVLQKQ